MRLAQTPPVFSGAALERASHGEKEVVSPAYFAEAMAQFAPFETKPNLAVAVSGGPDSMALFLLAQAWAEACGGSVLALIVDHGLRPESAGETALVAETVRRRGARAEVLTWTGPKPTTGVQAAARDARYRLLIHACRRAGVLHLLVGHQADDQRETVAERISAGSRLEGVAGMAAATEGEHVRILRPLLGMRRAALAATASTHGVVAVDDPSNRNLKFARACWRRAALPDGLDAAAATAAATRRAVERRVAAALARCVALHPVGAASIDPLRFAALPASIRTRVMAQTLRCVSGGDYAASRSTAEGAANRLVDGFGRGFTAGGCRLLPRGERWLAVRESRGIGQVDADGRWDGRFALGFRAGAVVARGAEARGADQAAVWRRLASAHPGIAAARATLPAGESGPILLKTEAPQGEATFRPRRALAEAAFSPCNAWPSPQFSHK